MGVPDYPCAVSILAAKARSVPTVHRLATQIASCSCKKFNRTRSSAKSNQFEAESIYETASILTTAITLNRHGITKIETSRQAAEALQPFAGNFAATLFTMGIVGVGFLAIPTLAGSAAYAFAETLGWRQGLNKKLRQARWFYALILVSTGVDVALDFIGINPVKALYWTAVINGLLAPFLLVAILIVAADKKLMQGQPSSRLGWIVVAVTTISMFVAGIAMFVV
jgi:Mn2+/Fe2+ NRAMP family transporter